MNRHELLESVNELVAKKLLEANAVKVEPYQLGLSSAAGYDLQASKSGGFIYCPRGGDTSLQYYGGFEYVDKAFRVEMGNHVFYFVDHSREDDNMCRIACCLENLVSLEDDPTSTTTGNYL